MSWFISAPEPTNWKLEPALLLKRLQERWPNAEIRHIGGSKEQNYVYEWRIRKSGKILQGQFDEAESAVALDGDIENAVDFAVWFRSVVPAEQDLLLYNEGFFMQIDLKPGTTERDLTAAVQNS